MPLSCLWQTGFSAYGQKPPRDEKAYTFGVVPQFDARRIETIWRPILDAVGKKAGVSFELEGAPSIPQFEQAFSSGAYDFAYMNPYHALVANRVQGYLPLLRDVQRALSGIIVVRKDNPITAPRELDGKTVVFPAPNALGASLIPRAEFQRTFGITIIPRYVKSHTSVYLNVFLQQADAGGGVQQTFEQQKPEVRNALRILYRTPKVPPHPIVAHPRVPEDVRLAVQNAFLELSSQPEGAALLSKVPISHIGLTSLEEYQPLKSMHLEDFYVTK